MAQSDLAAKANLIRAAISNFLGLLDGIPKTEQHDLKTLTITLDGLVAAYHPTTEADTDDVSEENIDAKRESYETLCQRVQASFPTLGYYNDVEPIFEENGEVVLASCIDDLADIAGDLQEVIWHLDQGNIVEALWEYRFGYQIHWGVHLHSLRRHLHSTTIAAW
ncbi:MAG: DUF5063 domain-containing protein [Sphingopyxis sp.]|nr:DUF5063 domain-containing protein [Sphingopyxis sp.]